MRGDPNTHKLTPSDVAGVPSIARDGEEWVIDDEGFGTAELDRLDRRCAFWRKLSDKMPV